MYFSDGVNTLTHDSLRVVCPVERPDINGKLSRSAIAGC